MTRRSLPIASATRRLSRCSWRLGRTPPPGRSPCRSGRFSILRTVTARRATSSAPRACAILAARACREASRRPTLCAAWPPCSAAASRMWRARPVPAQKTWQAPMSTRRYRVPWWASTSRPPIATPTAAISSTWACRSCAWVPTPPATRATSPIAACPPCTRSWAFP